MIPNIYKCLRKNGQVVFSGILSSQKEEIIKILQQHIKMQKKNLDLGEVLLKKEQMDQVKTAMEQREVI